MRSHAGRCVLLLTVFASGCIFQSERRPAIDVNLQAASSYVFRGQTMTERPVAQVATAVQLPTKDGGSASLGAFGNLDATDHVGTAWMDSGHAGEFTQMDLWGAYDRRIGDVDATLGYRYYSWPNGETFRFAPFPSTSEVFLRLGGELAGFRPSVAAHYDVDEVESVYLRAEVARTWDLSKTLHLELQTWLGWSDEEHSQWLYRTSKSAFADAGGSIGLGLDLDDVTSAHFAVAGSTIVDSSLRSWFSDRIDAEVVWFTAGIAWSF